MEQQPAKSSKEQWEAHIESLVQGMDLDDMKEISTRDVMASLKESQLTHNNVPESAQGLSARANCRVSNR